MKLNEFIENFANQFDDTDVSEITAATEFKALDEWSSLVALSIIAMVDEEYDVTTVSYTHLDVYKRQFFGLH